MSRQPVIFDCDGVLLDWEKGFYNWLKKFYPGHCPKTPYPAHWDLHHWIGCDKEMARRLIEAFNTSTAFGELQPMPSAQRVVHDLHIAGHPLYVVTSCSGEGGVRARRMQNLVVEFGKVFQNVICLPLGMSKLDTLKAFHTVLGRCIWVEDNYQNAAHGYEAGHETFFLHRPHNLAYQGLRERDGQEIKHLDQLSDLVSLFT